MDCDHMNGGSAEHQRAKGYMERVPEGEEAFVAAEASDPGGRPEVVVERFVDLAAGR